MSLQPDDQFLEDQQSLPLSQASQLLTSFTQFLTICIHNILYYRSIYPTETFLTSRAYNLPVHQSRHPKVCSWIRDAVDAVKAQLILGVVERIAVVIYDGQARVMERWMFDVASFPAWKGFTEAKNIRMDEEDELDEEILGNIENAMEGKVNWADVDEQLRATVRKLAYAAEKLKQLPNGCTFTIAVELRDEGEAPIGHPQPWIPTQSNLQTKSKNRETAGQDVGGAKTTTLRAVEAGPLFFECWVEEGEAKEQHSSNTSRE
ncbi:DNA-binding protein [Annulohypoxylon maeteangense]|uniref:DNA-binding protein n=1 Tax=Annulohypoxylon maeteangense TaxID=1927788 RepID=UPI002008C550|nr:DNA-binding protein [Annulohypoxylon maeteangense]KAI0890269.1 DNA-binding protein [Annulohypoxylon maeteangense]